MNSLSPTEPPPSSALSMSRVEAFSDGVLAIAVTLLVFDIGVPSPVTHASLGHALAQRWPHFVAYAVSFLTIGIIWINHHITLRRLATVDHTMLILNLLLLMAVAILPWSTSLMATYLRESHGQHLAAAIYAGSFLVMSCVFYALMHHSLIRRPDVLTPHLSHADRRAIARRNIAGLPPYVVATAAAAVSAYLTLAICGAVAVYYALATRAR